MRFQGENDEKYLVDWKTKIEAGEDYHFAFTFDQDEIALYLNGELLDADTGYSEGMTDNTEDLVIGGSTRTRVGEDDNIEWHFDGTIENFVMLDRPLEEIELLFLSENNGNVDSLGALYGNPVEIEEEEGTTDDTSDNDDSDETSNDEQDDTTNETADDDEQDETSDDGDTDESQNDGSDDTNEDDGSASEETTEEETTSETDEEENDDTPMDQGEGEEESGIGAIFTAIINALLSIFGLGGSDDAPSNAPSEEEIETTLTEVEELLSGLLTDPIEDGDGTQPVAEEEDDGMIMMM